MENRPQQRGTIYTFYSYKGGAGRTMALANAATLLARWGHSVLAVDWDLEAPGLERFFERDHEASPRSSKPGLLELIEANTAGEKLDWRNCISERNGVSIICSGRDDADYPRRIQELDFADLFANKGLGKYIEELRDAWSSDYEFVLIDSRTGVTDIGGICTVHLPDILVALVTANDSSIRGVLDVAKRAKSARSKLSVDRAPIAVLPILAREESRTEYTQANLWRSKILEAFNNLYREWLPKSVTVAEAIDTLRIPYVPYWSFGEQLPVLWETTRDASTISYAYELLARLLVNHLDWEKAISQRSPLLPTAALTSRSKADWLERHRKIARIGLGASGRTGFMEVFHFCLDTLPESTRTQLLAAASRAAVHTFGWPIGVVLENSPDGKPSPVGDGIVAEIRSMDDAYDYWTLSQAGDFYTLMSLFEDERTEGKLFFDTRIIRVTEAVLHGIRLYKALGAEDSARLELTIRHGGLHGRVLSAASPNRAPLMFRKASIEDEITSPTVRFQLGAEEPEIVRIVCTICAPLFEVFDFQEFSEDIYAATVTHFIKGQVT